MSVSARRHLAAIYAYSDGGTEGETSPVYTRVNSPDSHHLWWCSRETPTGHESTVGWKAEHRLDVIMRFSTAAPVNPASTGQHALVVLDGVQYLVRAVLEEDIMAYETKVAAERVAGAGYPVVDT